MRSWLRDRMRRRSKRGPNTSESTGKIGQELPRNQPAPLQPSYHGGGGAGGRRGEGEPGAEAASPIRADPVGTPARPQPVQKLVVETQPESVATPPPEAPATATGKGAR